MAEPLNGLVPEGTATVPNVPSFTVNGFIALGANYELRLLCNENRAAFDSKGAPGLTNVPILALTLNPQVAKELAWMLKNYVDQIESVIGPIKSDFLDSQKTV